ncbi:tetratricopeptide repeat protein [Bacteroidota bacterium]
MTNIYCSEIDELMQIANQNYQEGKYEIAIDNYNDILSRSYVSESIFYNLGNAYYRNGKLGLAILSYERGLRIEPNDEDIKYNLKILSTRTVDKIQEVPKLFIIEWWEILITTLSISNWSLLVIISYIILLICLLLYFIGNTRRIKKFGFLLGSTTFAILLILIILLFSSIRRETSKNQGILIETEITVKQSPQESSNDVFVIHEGLKFIVEEEFSDWAKIKLIDGKVGWLPKSSFEII